MSYPFLTSVNKPSRYLGTEINSVHKDWQTAQLHVALVFPDLYEIGMSYLGLSILYDILNRQEQVLAERVFAPDLDLERLLHAHSHPLLSLESRRPLKDFDLIGFTLPYELCYSNILTILATSNIPFRASDRDRGYPVIIAGGSCAVNPEPVADFFDAIMIGDGEDAVLEIADIVSEWKDSGRTKAALLDDLSQVEGLYVPSLFQVHYGTNGAPERIEGIKPGYSKISRRVIPDLNGAPYPLSPIVPFTRPVHDRISLEISRGCTRGCRFCQAGIVYRPVREREPGEILRLAEKTLASTGHEEISLLSLSTGDYSNISPLLKVLMDRFACEYVAVSMPSLRVGTVTPEIMAEIKRVRKTGFTLAPEAGTKRLRDVINKNISEEDLLDTAGEAFDAGWNLLKLYFMIGLPTETKEDLDGIAELAKKVLKAGGKGKRRAQVNIGISTFVPKAHTPFQWQAQIGLEESLSRLNYLKSSLRDRRIQVKWHDPHQSHLEGVFARGGRELSGLIERAHALGCRLDGWGDHFQFALWQKAAEEADINFEWHMRPRETGRFLPWNHIDSHVSEEYLRAEAQKAYRGEVTPDCRKAGCLQCGVCGNERNLHISEPFSDTYAVKSKGPIQKEYTKIRINYGKLEEARFLSHLELTRLFVRGFRRAGLNVEYSQGFHPMPKISFSPALPIGTESVAEFINLSVWSGTKLSGLLPVLQKEMPLGIVLYNLQKIPTGMVRPGLNYYRVRSTEDIFNAVLIKSFLNAEAFNIERKRKGHTGTVDIRPLVSSLYYIDSRTVAFSVSNVQEPGAKPAEMMQAIFSLSDKNVEELRILKLPGYPETEQICQQN